MLSTKSVPSISIITINRNTGDAVKGTITSILNQHQSCEWIVVDGGSTDNSIGLLRAALRPGDRIISEPDRGISDAFNKGLALATGEAVLFMNAGDTFAAPTALGELVKRWDQSHHRWITGTAEVLDASGKRLYQRQMQQPKDPFELLRSGCRIFHQATLTNRLMLLEAGGFDLSYRLAMDYDLWCRLMKHGFFPQVEPVLVCRYGGGGVSGDTMRCLAEQRKARARNGISNGWCYEAGLWLVAWVKSMLRRYAGQWAYRLKEWLRL